MPGGMATYSPAMLPAPTVSPEATLNFTQNMAPVLTLAALVQAPASPLTLPEGLQDFKSVPDVNLNDTLPDGMPSIGSGLHASGECQPCAWFWKPSGCQNGQVCNRCHLCPQGAVKARKRAKHAMMRLGLASPKPTAGQELNSKPKLSFSDYFMEGEPAHIAVSPESISISAWDLADGLEQISPAPTEKAAVETLPTTSPPPPPPTAKPTLPIAALVRPEAPVPPFSPPQEPPRTPPPMAPPTAPPVTPPTAPPSLPPGVVPAMVARGRNGAEEQLPPGLGLPPGTPSRGSVLHGAGNCQPCAWFFKPGSCQNATDCRHCHLCPEGEIKARKRQKLTMMRLGLATPAGMQHQVSFGMDDDPDTPPPEMASEQAVANLVDESDGEQGDTQQAEVASSSPASTNQDLPSRGSVLHGSGSCQPCAWFWKPSGCHNSKECRHCHLCPEGEIKARKKKKMVDMRTGAAATVTADQPRAAGGSALLPGVTPRNRTGSDSDHLSTTASGSGSEANASEELARSPTAKSCIGVEIPLPPGLRAPPGTPSHGSTLHGVGKCHPCPWFWKSTGCPSAQDCGYCHLCSKEESMAAANKKRAMLRLGLATPKDKQPLEAARALLSMVPSQEDAHSAPSA